MISGTVSGFIKKNRLLSILLIILFGLICYNRLEPYNQTQNVNTIVKSEFYVKHKLIGEFKSQCECRKDKIRLVQSDDLNYRVLKVDESGRESEMYSIPVEEYKQMTFTCGMYNTLRRGKKIKIQSYSLFGGKSVRNGMYYDKFILNMKNLPELYPGWLIRVSYDTTIDPSIICQVECAKDETTGKYMDNADFCNITEIPKSGLDFQNVWSAFYMHPMKYRWLAVGDSFVDAFNSRDSDGFLIERDAEAVKEWFSTSKYCHLMRDHPWHTVHMLGGAWGIYNERNRNRSRKIYQVLTDRSIAGSYHKEGQNMIKGRDQDFLGQHVYPIIANDVIAHDSYLCRSFGGQPFPTKRKGNCYVCNAGPCDPVNGVYEHKCPMQCRHKDHLDWDYC